MPINPSIILGIQPAKFQLADPLESAQKSLALQHLMGQQDMQALQLDQTRRAQADQDRLRSILGKDTPDLEGELTRGGFLDQALKVGKERRENKKIDSETGKIAAETVEKTLANYKSALPQLAGPQDAVGWLTAQYNDPVLGPIMQRMAPLEQAIQRVPQDAQGFRDWQFKASAGIDKFMVDQRQREQNAETERHNLSTETETQRNNRANNAIAQGQLGVAQGNLGVARDRLRMDQSAPKGVYDPERAVLVDPRTGQAMPVTMDGQPLGPKEKLTDAQKKELASIDSQQNILKGALAEVDKSPDAFSTARGLATMAGAIPESMAGKWMDTPAQREARSYVFNVVSKVINERAGAAQSAQELARLRSFLPAETDNAQQIKDKLTSFSSYLENSRAGYDKPQGIRMPGAAQPAQLVPGATRPGPVAQPGAVKFLGFE